MSDGARCHYCQKAPCECADAPVPSRSLQEVARRLHAKQSSIEETLGWMNENGQAVSLSSGEDNNSWECAWIADGKRHLGFQTDMRLAILQSLNECFAHLMRKIPLATEPAP